MEQRNGSTPRIRGKYLFPVKALSKVFRAKFLDELNKANLLKPDLHKKLTAKSWVVYAKRPFRGPQQVTEYLGRYTHKIAISNHRITDVGQDHVSFSVKDYRKGGKKQVCKLSKKEFIRRFSMHVLPKAFVRIRHYGILSTSGKKKYLVTIRKQTGTVKLEVKHKPIQLGRCPACKKGNSSRLQSFKTEGRPSTSPIS